MSRLLHSVSMASALAMTLSLSVSGALAQSAPAKPPAAAPAPAPAAAPAPAPAPSPAAQPEKAAPSAVAPAAAPAAPVAPAAPAGETAAPAASADPLDGGPLPQAPQDQATSDPEAGSTAVDLSQPRVIDTSKPREATAEPEPEPEPEPKIDPNTLPFTYHMKHIDLAVGLRFIGTPDEGLDPFLYEPAMGDIYLRAGYAFPLAGRFALGALVEASTSDSEADVRGRPTSLSLGRFTLGLEGRYHFHHRLYGYGRLAPGVELGYAKWGVNEGIYPDMRGESAAFVLDSSLGLAFRFAGAKDGRKKGVRFWGFAEGGYRYAGNHKFVLEGHGGSEGFEPITLDPLSTSGGFFSTGLMLTF